MITSKIKALESVASAWSRDGIKFAVANGLGQYPASIGRDIDVVVERGSLGDAVQSVIATLSMEGWWVIPNLQGWIWWVVAFKPNENEGLDSLQIDLFEHLQWAFTRVVDGIGLDSPLIPKGPFLEDPGSVVGKTLIINGLSTGSRSFRKKPAYLDLTTNQMEALPKVLARISGMEQPELVEAIFSKDLARIDEGFRKIKRSCYVKAIFGASLISRIRGAFQKQWVVNWRPNQGAPVITLSGLSSSVTTIAIETVKKIFKPLVFQDLKILEFEKTTLSERKLTRLSCLQVVLLLVDPPPFRKLRAGLSLCGQGEEIELKCHPDGTSWRVEPSDLERATSELLAEWLQNTSARQIGLHGFTTKEPH